MPVESKTFAPGRTLHHATFEEGAGVCAQWGTESQIAFVDVASTLDDGDACVSLYLNVQQLDDFIEALTRVRREATPPQDSDDSSATTHRGDRQA